jgi:hypothetical protein
MSTFQQAARTTFIAASCAILFIASLYGMRSLNPAPHTMADVAMWTLRGSIRAE